MFRALPIYSLFGALLVSGCMTLPVTGLIQNSDETFQGKATGYMDGAGDLEVVSSKGAVCKGSFVYINGRQGSGIFNCSDGRSGPFQFVSTGTRGNGQGTLGGQTFIFTFGS